MARVSLRRPHIAVAGVEGGGDAGVPEYRGDAP